MSNQLYNIMVPVDFTVKNKWAIAKAMELANTFHCNIHFVHILHKPLIPFIPVDKTDFTPYESTADLHECRKKLEDLKSSCSNQLCGAGKIEISVLHGTPHKMLPKYIKQYEMDLVVTGLSKFNLLQRIISSVSISRLVRKTNIPVLAVRSNGLISHFKKIVLPLYNDVPLRSIKMATMLGRHSSQRYILYRCGRMSQVRRIFSVMPWRSFKVYPRYRYSRYFSKERIWLRARWNFQRRSMPI